MRSLAGAPVDETHLTGEPELGDLDRGELSTRDLGQRAALRQQGHAETHLDRALDPVQARQPDLDVDRRVALLVEPEHPLAGRRRLVVGDHGLAAELLHGDARSSRQRMPGIDQHDELVVAEGEGLQAPLARREGQHPEVERAAEHFPGDLPGRDAAHLDLGVGMIRTETLDDREQDVHRPFVGADQHAAAPQILQLANRVLGFRLELREALCVVEQQLARLGQTPALRGPVEQPLVELVLQPPDRLADGGLRPVQALRGAREAALVGDGEEDLQLGEIHGDAPRATRAPGAQGPERGSPPAPGTGRSRERHVDPCPTIAWSYEDGASISVDAPNAEVSQGWRPAAGSRVPGGQSTT